MIGITLMVIGTLIFATGLIFFIKSNDKVLKINNMQLNNKSAYIGKHPNTDKVSKSDQTYSGNNYNNNKAKSNTNSETELNNYKKQNIKDYNEIIEIAVADGILTSNEKKIIKEIAFEKNLDYNKIISNAENQLKDRKSDSETELIDFNKRNGDDFEKFVIQKFDKEYFTIKEWAGDKYVNGIYAKTTPQPDILIEFRLKQKTSEFSVECKWRKSLFKNGVEFAKNEQFERYKDFQKDKNIPVFIAIGIGGKGKQPEQLFIIPLKEINSNFIHINTLKNYEKNMNNNFFFDYKTKELK